MLQEPGVNRETEGQKGRTLRTPSAIDACRIELINNVQLSVRWFLILVLPILALALAASFLLGLLLLLGQGLLDVQDRRLRVPTRARIAASRWGSLLVRRPFALHLPGAQCLFLRASGTMVGAGGRSATRRWHILPTRRGAPVRRGRAARAIAGRSRRRGRLLSVDSYRVLFRGLYVSHLNFHVLA